MKTKFTALLAGAAGACALLCAPAQAQISISGRVDQSVVKTNPGPYSVTHGSSPRLIFQGKEDLGGGMTSYFYLQQRFDADTGASRNPFWYYSYVGLRGNFGDVSLGYMKSPIDDGTGSHYEVWDGDTVASSISRIAGGQKIWDNAVNYTSPEFGGFRINVGTSLDEDIAGRVRGQGASLLYDGNGLSAAASVQRSPTNVETKAIGARYAIGAFRVLGTWAHSTRVSKTKEQTDWQLSAGYRFIPSGEARILYNHVDAAGVVSKKIGIGYFHDLSKRTGLYVAASTTHVDKKPTVNMYQVGIRHLF
jgi:predicted porin